MVIGTSRFITVERAALRRINATRNGNRSVDKLDYHLQRYFIRRVLKLIASVRSLIGFNEAAVYELVQNF